MLCRSDIKEGVTGHENRTYYMTDKRFYDLIHENTEYFKCLEFKVTEQKNHFQLRTGFLKFLSARFIIVSKI